MNENKENNDKNKNKKNITIAIVGVVIVLAILVLFNVLARQIKESQRIEISYSEFLTMLDKNEVDSVSVLLMVYLRFIRRMNRVPLQRFIIPVILRI